MTTLTYDTIPDGLTLHEPYTMQLNRDDFELVATIVNQGIDSHLEAVFTAQRGNEIDILDTQSMRTFLRRCLESSDDRLDEQMPSVDKNEK